MNVAFMVSFAGPDSSNLLANLAKFTHDHDGKWLSSKISYLEGHIAANIKVVLPEKHARIVKAHFISQHDLSIKIDDISLENKAANTAIKLCLKANDRPGLVFDISHLIQEFGADILNMETHRLQVQAVGGMVFFSNVDLCIPEALDINLLISELKTLDDSLVITQE